MRKAIIITSLILSSILILDTFSFGYALAMFFLAGVVPGTQLVVSADQMLSLYALLLGFVFARVSQHFIRAAMSRKAIRTARA